MVTTANAVVVAVVDQEAIVKATDAARVVTRKVALQVASTLSSVVASDAVAVLLHRHRTAKVATDARQMSTQLDGITQHLMQLASMMVQSARQLVQAGDHIGLLLRLGYT